MIRRLTLILMLAALSISAASAYFPYGAPDKWSERMAQTVMTRYPSALTIPFKPWCYPQGYFLSGLDKLWRSTGDRKYYDYIMNWAENPFPRSVLTIAA